MPTELNERDAKLVQWLQEAYAKESELETDLATHIVMTAKPAYRKRLEKHLDETRDHKRRVAARIKKLGGSAEGGGVTGLVAEAAGKGIAAIKGPLDVARAAVTEQAETHLRNAQAELREEHVEIALYTRIEAFANQVGDTETVRLATSIRRDEERMAKFLDSELVRLVKDVVRAEVPSEQRGQAASGSRRRSTSSSTASKSGSSSRARSSSGSTRRTRGSTTRTKTSA